MDLTNELVEHPFFGTGRVIVQDNQRINIQFSGETAIKRFIYPDAFERFLSMNNPAAAQTVLADLTAKKERIEEQQRKEEEAEQEARENFALATSKIKLSLKTKQPKAHAKK